MSKECNIHCAKVFKGFLTVRGSAIKWTEFIRNPLFFIVIFSLLEKCLPCYSFEVGTGYLANLSGKRGHLASGNIDYDNNMLKNFLLTYYSDKDFTPYTPYTLTHPGRIIFFC